MKHKTFFKEVPIRLVGKALEALRDECYERDKGLCQQCGKWMPRHGEVLERAHMAHRKGRGAGGDDRLSNVRLLCAFHHGTEHGYGKDQKKPCPPKLRHATV